MLKIDLNCDLGESFGAGKTELAAAPLGNIIAS